MRISTSMFYRQGANSMAESQSMLVRTQMQLSSGQRLLSAADDPVASARLLQLDTAAAQTEQYQRNSVMARNRLGIQEQTLSDVENVLFRIRDLAIQANNDTLDNTSRAYIAAEVDEMREQLVQLGNTRDSEGNFLFSGFKSQTQPFSQISTGVRYNGDQGQRNIQISDTRTVQDGDSGSDIFMAIANGTGEFTVSASASNTGTGQLGTRSVNDANLWDSGDYTIRFTSSDAYNVLNTSGAIVSSGSYSDGETLDVQGVSIALTGIPESGDEFSLGPSRQQDMFTTVQNFIDALDSSVSPAGTATLHNQVGNVLEDIDRGIDNLLDFRTRVGTRLQAIDAQEVSNADFSITLASASSQLRDLDYADAVTRLSQQLTGLEAAQQSFARIQGLTLFNLI